MAANEKKKAWVWFKGGIQGGYWKGGFLALASDKGGMVIEKPDFVTCRVPEWRVIFSEPKEVNKGPNIPQEATWKFIPN